MNWIELYFFVYLVYIWYQIAIITSSLCSSIICARNIGLRRLFHSIHTSFGERRSTFPNSAEFIMLLAFLPLAICIHFIAGVIRWAEKFKTVLVIRAIHEWRRTNRIRTRVSAQPEKWSSMENIYKRDFGVTSSLGVGAMQQSRLYDIRLEDKTWLSSKGLECGTGMPKPDVWDFLFFIFYFFCIWDKHSSFVSHYIYTLPTGNY